jgi:TonB family protein
MTTSVLDAARLPRQGRLETAAARLALHLALVLATTATLLAPPARAGGDEALAVRLALVVGNRGESPLPQIGDVLSEKLLADYLGQWDPHSDNPEIQRLFALRGLSEVTRQAARLQPGGGTLAGTARIGGALWRVEVDVARNGSDALFGVRIHRGDELVSAPKVRSALGEKAIVSTTSEEDAVFLFLVVQAEPWSAVQARLPLTPQPAGAGVDRARVVHKVNPEYPDGERASRRQGVVVVQIAIDEQGEVSDARIVRSLAPAFDEAALDAVRQWRFDPPRRDGKPVASELTITINFVPGDHPPVGP